MKRTTKYVAFDVHQATTVASARDDGGRVLARSVLEKHGPSIVEFLRGICGALHVAFEGHQPRTHPGHTRRKAEFGPRLP